MKLYRVKDWNERYENNRTRDLKNMAWVPVPNSHDGDGYTALVCQPDGPALFGAWTVILQVASRCGNPALCCGGRGTLLRDTGIPHDASSIARMTRFPKDVIAKALEVLSSAEIQWLTCEEMPTKAQIPQEGAGKPHPDAAKPQEGAPKPHPTDEEQKGMEQKGTEWKEREGGAAAPRARFEKPSVESVRLQMAKVGVPESEAEKFMAHYESNGWRVGKNPMKSWSAAITNWKLRMPSYSTGKQKPEANQLAEYIEVKDL